MTLSGKSDRQERVEAARAIRQERGAVAHAKRPWVMPVIVTVAILVIVGVLIFTVASGMLV
ncbi:MAG TPA: hypothetical protein VGO65_12575 [Pseudolysinimonas sp.]|jgi:hypothetical protein|nr:hypothetical protein [Schumannella sp.]HEV7743242.1 hypothetical protein [Pseudolysinimonas sp.]